ncbi:MAG: ATPase P [Clostridiales bacterium]|jgi:soluble P-type ATPase|nr:ATPase P [Eubacteriales bacterium]MDH7566551.1 ATPase P [Clostridiales bacterium]
MLRLTIPGRSELYVENVVFDFNGTLATDGKLSPSVREKIARLKAELNVFILSSDTYGTVAKECRDLGVSVSTLSGEHCSTQKKNFVSALGPEKTICIGNGANDIGMFQVCALSIIIIGAEGCSAKALVEADIAVRDVEEALDLLFNPKRITATLRE